MSTLTAPKTRYQVELVHKDLADDLVLHVTYDVAEALQRASEVALQQYETTTVVSVWRYVPDHGSEIVAQINGLRR